MKTEKSKTTILGLDERARADAIRPYNTNFSIAKQLDTWTRRRNKRYALKTVFVLNNSVRIVFAGRVLPTAVFGRRRKSKGPTFTVKFTGFEDRRTCGEIHDISLLGRYKPAGSKDRNSSGRLVRRFRGDAIKYPCPLNERRPTTCQRPCRYNKSYHNTGHGIVVCSHCTPDTCVCLRGVFGTIWNRGWGRGVSTGERKDSETMVIERLSCQSVRSRRLCGTLPQSIE